MAGSNKGKIRSGVYSKDKNKAEAKAEAGVRLRIAIWLKVGV